MIGAVIYNLSSTMSIDRPTEFLNLEKQVSRNRHYCAGWKVHLSEANKKYRERPVFANISIALASQKDICFGASSC